MTDEIIKLYENAGIKPEYRYDCNLADTIKPVEVFPLRGCSKGEIKDYCINKQDYRYCKVYKVNKIYPPFTAEKQLELIKWLAQKDYYTCDYCEIEPRKNGQEWLSYCHFKGSTSNTFEKALAGLINEMWQSLTEEEKQQVKGILE